eukprot:29185-Pelagococcus_subviridis.AAC.10
MRRRRARARLMKSFSRTRRDAADLVHSPKRSAGAMADPPRWKRDDIELCDSFEYMVRRAPRRRFRADGETPRANGSARTNIHFIRPSRRAIHPVLRRPRRRRRRSRRPGGRSGARRGASSTTSSARETPRAWTDRG